MLWLSTERSNFYFNCATFRLSWVRSLHCPFKNVFLFSMRILYKDSTVSEPMVNRKLAQLKWQLILSIDSQSIISLFSKACILWIDQNWSIIRSTLSHRRMLEHLKIAVFERKCRDGVLVAIVILINRIP